jgi:hypothetical protein
MRINQRQRLLAILAISGLGLLISDWFVFTPLTHLWQARSKKSPNSVRRSPMARRCCSGNSSFAVAGMKCGRTR